jgi:hypothetical protein
MRTGVVVLTLLLLAACGGNTTHGATTPDLFVGACVDLTEDRSVGSLIACEEPHDGLVIEQIPGPRYEEGLAECPEGTESEVSHQSTTAALELPQSREYYCIDEDQ